MMEMKKWNQYPQHFENKPKHILAMARQNKLTEERLWGALAGRRRRRMARWPISQDRKFNNYHNGIVKAQRGRIKKYKLNNYIKNRISKNTKNE
jgi:hypothetical protein